jgi:hypothetical protein
VGILFRSYRSYRRWRVELAMLISPTSQKAGATSVTRNGVTVTFGAPSASSEVNPWDELYDAPDLSKVIPVLENPISSIDLIISA